jgi:hypothetical protein
VGRRWRIEKVVSWSQMAPTRAAEFGRCLAMEFNAARQKQPHDFGGETARAYEDEMIEAAGIATMRRGRRNRSGGGSGAAATTPTSSRC